MTVVITILLLALVYSTYRGADYYLDRSMVSFRNAERAWSELTLLARELVARDLPPRVAKLVVAMTASAGCGCFIRGVIISHYVPQLLRRYPNEERSLGPVFEQIENLDAESRDLFWKFQVHVMVYDSFRNPAQGWLFRRALKETLKPEVSYSTKREAQSAVFSVVARRKAQDPKGLLTA